MINRKVMFYMAAAVIGLSVAVYKLVQSGTVVSEGKRTFDGRSSDLEKTVVVPALESTLPEGQNMIWCSSFQVAWNELKDVVNGPVKLNSNPPITDFLNTAKQSKDDISPENVYARAGLVQDGIIQEIKAEMALKFPGEMVSIRDVAEPAIIAYAYQQANVRFTVPYVETNWPLVFTDPFGKKTQVTSFMPRGKTWNAISKRGERAAILFAVMTEQYEVTEFAVDLCPNSSPDQVVVARLVPKDNLLETYLYIEEKMKGNAALEMEEDDVLLVPNLCWKIRHDVSELHGQCLENAGYEGMPIAKAMQVIEFQLDRRGAILKSEAVVEAAASQPREFICDRPFLIYMKKRGATYPFFMMWIENAELLGKWEG